MSIPVVFASKDASLTLPDGGQVRIRIGDHWAAGDPLVAQYPDMFTADSRYGMRYTRRPANWDGEAEDASAGPGVESATAGPGERRATPRGRR